MKTIAKRAVTATAVGALVFGGAITMASSASADPGSGSCNNSLKLHTDVNTTVKFRSGPGTGYTAKGQLSKGTKVYWACNKGSTGSTKSWGYVKPTSGKHKGEKGWVASRYINMPMEPSS